MVGKFNCNLLRGGEFVDCLSWLIVLLEALRIMLLLYKWAKQSVLSLPEDVSSNTWKVLVGLLVAPGQMGATASAFILSGQEITFKCLTIYLFIFLLGKGWKPRQVIFFIPLREMISISYPRDTTGSYRNSLKVRGIPLSTAVSRTCLKKKKKTQIK